MIQDLFSNLDLIIQICLRNLKSTFYKLRIFLYVFTKTSKPSEHMPRGSTKILLFTWWVSRYDLLPPVFYGKWAHQPLQLQGRGVPVVGGLVWIIKFRFIIRKSKVSVCVHSKEKRVEKAWINSTPLQQTILLEVILYFRTGFLQGSHFPY